MAAAAAGRVSGGVGVGVGGWRRLLRRYVDARFRSHAADKIFDVVAHTYDRWDEKPGAAFLDARGQKVVTGREVTAGHDVSGGRDEVESARSDEIARELLTDSHIAAPTIRMAKLHATCSPGKTRAGLRPNWAWVRRDTPRQKKNISVLTIPQFSMH